MQRTKKLLLPLLFLLVGISSLPAQTYRTRLKRANNAYEIHAYNVAIPEFLSALERRSDESEPLAKLADSYRMLNQLEEAATYYAQAVRQKDVEKIYILQYAKTLKGLGRYDEAKQWFLLYARDADAMIGNHYAQSCDFAMQQMNTPSSYSVTNEFINTSSAEFGPAFFGSQNVVFSSARSDIQTTGSFNGKQGNQLFSATMGSRGYLENPVFIRGNAGAQEFNEGPVSYTSDGRQVAFTRNNFVDGTRMIPEAGIETSIYLATVNQSGDWVDVKPFPHNGTDFSTGFPSFSPDGNTLFFAADRADSYGGFDIYVSYRTAGSWSTPENLGAVINSPGDEITPFFDGTMLFFSSNWHQGLGGFDIFRGERGTGNRWSRIYHLGNAVNSPRDDYGYIYDPFRNVGYLASNRLGGRGNEDLYSVSRAADNIVLRVRNAIDGSAIPNAMVDFSNCGEGIYQTDANGTYTFQAVQGLNCNLLITKEGYLTANVAISTSGTNQSREYDVTLSRMGEAYAGRIVGYSTRTALGDVVVTATNRSTGNTTETRTDQNGDYYLALSPYSSYILRYSAPGYREVNFTVDTRDGLDRSILGVISMLPATQVGPSTPGVVPGQVPDQPIYPGNEPVAQDGFAVQVAAVNKANMGDYSNLNSFGEIYSVEDKGTYKIRVGLFNTREEALSVMQSIRNSGYRDAFLVRETGLMMGGSTASQPLTNPTPGPNSETLAARGGLYKVQLAAYRNPEYFDPTPVANLGVIEERMKGDLTVKFIGGIQTLTQARQALSQARAAGFNTAFIVVEENGELRKVN
jgi:hypothetical protein